jgi:hypothetical protein
MLFVIGVVSMAVKPRLKCGWHTLPKDSGIFMYLNNTLAIFWVSDDDYYRNAEEDFADRINFKINRTW